VITKNNNILAREALKDVVQNTTFGQFVRSIRECDNITQIDLAKKMTSVYHKEKFVGGRSGLIYSIKYAQNILEKCMDILGMSVLEKI
jgi:transcriptional regulator with XRE-family HTH domain